MYDELIAVIVGSLIGLFGSYIAMFITLWLDRRREERDRAMWQLANINTYYFSQYLSEEIKASRERLDSVSVKGANIPEGLSRDQRRISHGLQRIGIMIYLGSIPLSYALVMNAYQIVHDWLLISGFIEEIRGSDNKDGLVHYFGKVPYHRRHGEWLALICWMWLVTQSFEVDLKSQGDIIAFEKYYGSALKIAERERLLFSNEKNFAAPSTITLVDKIRQKFFGLRIKSFMWSFVIQTRAKLRSIIRRPRW